jgi:DNA invertase Pin-like site-specific DNA recombinase
MANLLKYIAYYRVSTKKQARSGLGLEAQQAIVQHFAQMDGATIVDEIIEAESGKDLINRPKLREAIIFCQQNDCILIVAKLDRLSRDVEDTFKVLKELEGRLIACDIPAQNGRMDSFTLAVFAGLAQRERELISIRTKLALKAKKARGAVLGKPENLSENARQKAYQASRDKALKNPNNRLATAYLQQVNRNLLTLQEIADNLNASGFKTAKGKQFKPVTVKRLMEKN